VFRFRQAVRVVLAGFVAVGGLPRLELSHDHEGGGLPHHHGHSDRERTDEFHDVHHGDHLGHGWLVHEHTTSVRPSDGHPVTSARATNRHTHGLLFGGLGGDWWRPLVPDASAIHDDSSTVQLTGPQETPRASHSLSIHALLKYLHGPPNWVLHQELVRLKVRPRADCGPDQLLCDVARHERTGVLLI
jgi:hypothetical protein